MAAKSSLSEYLKKYTSDENPKSKLQKKKKKKKAKPKSSVNAGGVRIVDEDAHWQAEIKEDSSQEDSPDDGPQVIEDVEVKRMKRWEELKAQRPYFSVDEDGSGWVTVADPKKPGLNSNELSSKEQGNTDSSNDENMHSAPLDGSPNKDHANVVRKDLQVANGQTNYEDGKFFSDAEDHESHHFLQTRVCHNSQDVSPPGKASTRSADLSPPRKHLKDAGSLYPLPQMHSRHDSSNLSPPRKAQTKSSDLSSPQMKGRHVSPDLSPPRKVRTKSPDLSPPRKRSKDVAVLDPLAQTKVRHDSPDLSPPRKGRTRSVDLSPPRKHQKNIGSSNQLQHKTVRHVSPDLSPPRKSQSPDLSPPRKRQKDILSSNSLLQRKDRHDSPDLSPPRKHKDVLSDEKDRSYRKHRENSPIQRHSRFSQIEDHGSSPPRTHYNYSGRADDSPTRKRIIPSTRIADQTLSEGHAMDRAKGMEKMKDGTTSGLRTGKDLKEEIDRKKKEEIKRFSKMDASLSGRGAETVYRDKRGKRLEGVEELMQLQKGQPKPEDKPLEWGKGLAQKREAEARQAELELEKNKPFARTRDDPELDKMLKERVRWGDPMAHLIKRKNVESVLENLDEDEKMKESGFIVPQDIPSHSWLKRGVDPSPNRYGIRPGRHWDGVDRSTGFEKELFKRQNEKRATETEAYLWSVADM